MKITTQMIDLILNDCQIAVHNKIDSLRALKNNVVVITGGTGFVGTWIASLIAYLNDNYSFNTQLFLMARNIENFKLTLI